MSLCPATSPFSVVNEVNHWSITIIHSSQMGTSICLSLRMEFFFGGVVEHPLGLSLNLCKGGGDFTHRGCKLCASLPKLAQVVVLGREKRDESRTAPRDSDNKVTSFGEADDNFCSSIRASAA